MGGVFSSWSHLDAPPRSRDHHANHCTIHHPTHPITSLFLCFLFKKVSPVKSGFFLSHHLTYKNTIILFLNLNPLLYPHQIPPNPSPNHHPPRHKTNKIKTSQRLNIHLNSYTRPHLITTFFQRHFSVQTFQLGPHFKTILFPYRKKRKKRMHRHAFTIKTNFLFLHSRAFPLWLSITNIYTWIQTNQLSLWVTLSIPLHLHVRDLFFSSSLSSRFSFFSSLPNPFSRYGSSPGLPDPVVTTCPLTRGAVPGFSDTLDCRGGRWRCR